jgi:uncharacterized protein
MVETPSLIPIIQDLFQKLRRRGFAIGLEDYQALQQSLRAGFGWESQQSFLNLCTSLWAKSREEREILAALFEQLLPDEKQWIYSLPQEATPTPSDRTSSKPSKADKPKLGESEPRTTSQNRLPPIEIEDYRLSKRPFIFVPQFPLTHRQVAQTWRRLHKPIRIGAPIELDIEATIARRCQLGVATEVVMRPRRRNIARLLLLVDRQGSMAPFHRFCEEVCRAIQESGRLGEATIYYFHNVPVEGADDRVLEPLTGQLFPTLDPILREIEPLKDGYVYTDADLLFPKSFLEVLDSDVVGASVVILSDAGAARRQYRVSRLLDTIACMKAIRTYSPNYVWLNPLAKDYWRNNTAGQIARHIPMFPLEREGIERAVNVLRGHPHMMEQSI